jgi:hypothetical protein
MPHNIFGWAKSKLNKPRKSLNKYLVHENSQMKKRKYMRAGICRHRWGKEVKSVSPKALMKIHVF